MSGNKRKGILFFFGIACLAFSSMSNSAGMIPETSVVIINVADGEGTINVTNSDNKVALLYTSLENLPEDTESLIIATPPVARVEGGEKQLVRFMVQSEKPIITQRLKRVNFEGIPLKDPNESSQIGVTVRQNLPVLITPADLPFKSDPWTLLKWTLIGNTLEVTNSSRYVVRMNQQVNIMPAKVSLTLSRSYILPGTTERLELPVDTRLAADAFVRFFPATLYGYAAKPFDAQLIQQ